MIACLQVSNPLAAVCNVGAYMHSTNLLVATSLRNVLGTKVHCYYCTCTLYTVLYLITLHCIVPDHSTLYCT